MQTSSTVQPLHAINTACCVFDVELLDHHSPEAKRQWSRCCPLANTDTSLHRTSCAAQ